MRASSNKCASKKCPKTKICNPASGRCVNRTGTIGKQLVHRRHPSPIRPRPSKSKDKCVAKKCPKTKICNPASGRCVNRTGTIGKQLILSEADADESKSETKQGDCVSRSKLPLRVTQELVVKYLDFYPSLLVVHTTGLGKTLTAVTASQCFLDAHPRSGVVFVGPTSLLDNFKKELRRYGVSQTEINRKYEFYSFAKFLNETKKRAGNDVRKPIERSGIGWPTNPIPLRGKMLIVDEAHNIRNAHSATSRALVKASFGASRRLLLTATPYINNVQDFIPLINILYGEYIVGTYREMLRRDVSEFLSKDLSKSPTTLQKLRILLRGKVDVILTKDLRDFPKRVNHTELVPMSKAYYKRYDKLMQGDSNLDVFFQNPERFYHGYRRAVNQAGAGYFSEKVQAAIPILRSGKSIVYTNWHEFGVKPITSELEKAGISFQLFTGATPVSDRQTIVDQFNRNEFQVLVVTKAGGEGLDLSGVRNVVILDPTWNNASIEQIIGRAIRYQSHAHLPKAERVVNVYYMIAIPPKTAQRSRQLIESGDTLLYNIIQRKEQEQNLVIQTLIQDSISNY
jgi:superfamily II DNA or RNA helicase